MDLKMSFSMRATKNSFEKASYLNEWEENGEEAQ